MSFANLSKLEIRQICYFLTVVDCDNSFSQAAANLYIQQPPLSQRIKALEKSLKVSLFDRRHRPVRLTAAGEVFYREARQAMAQLEHAMVQATRADRGDIGHLRIGLASSAANGVLSDLLLQFRASWPNVTLSLKELTAEQQISEIEAERLDVGLEVIDPALLARRSLQWKVVAKEELVVALPEGHALSKRQAVSLEALATEPLILPNVQAFPFYQAFLDECAIAGLEPQLVESTTATWMLTILSLVAAGVGLAVLPSNVLNLQRKGVTYRPISGLNLDREIVAVWQKENDSATLREFLFLLNE